MPITDYCTWAFPKMKRTLSAAIAAITLLGSAHQAIGFEMLTHWTLSNAALRISNLSKDTLLSRIGLQNVIDTKKYRAWNVGAGSTLPAVEPSCDPKSPPELRGLLSCGAMYGDIPGPRSFSHFFDPANGGKLLQFMDLNPEVVTGKTQICLRPTGPSGIKSTPSVNCSHNRDARNYFYQALTSGGPAETKGEEAKTGVGPSKSLGQIIHHVQDMAQPQHTRNDPHADWLDVFGYVQFGQLRHPSRFERFATSKMGTSIVGQLVSSSLEPVFPAYSQQLRLPRDFWTGNDRGIADYSNKHFVSQGTNFVWNGAGLASNDPRFSPPLPRPAPATLSPSEAFSPNPVPSVVAIFCDPLSIYSCLMTFYANEWTDPLNSAFALNDRASTESIFDEDLRIPVNYDAENGQITTERIFALNQINFSAALGFLFREQLHIPQV